MLRTGKLDISPNNREPRITKGTHLHKTMILSPDPSETLTPNGFLIDQAANSTIPPHFHTNCQFQVFAGGKGLLGRKPAEPFIVQYVAAHTGYGPIVASEEGLMYFTLRPSTPAGAKYLPESRDLFDKDAPKRQVTSATFPPGSANAEHPVVEMIEPGADGLAAWMIYLAPGKKGAAPRHPGGLARYYVVTKGEMLVKGAQLTPFSMAFTSGDDLDLEFEAGAQGVEALCMQFPGDAY